jgi:hypothetical protein
MALPAARTMKREHSTEKSFLKEQRSFWRENKEVSGEKFGVQASASLMHANRPLAGT